MSLAGKLKEWIGASDTIRVRVLIRGRIGDGWFDVDQVLKLAPDSTLSDLIETCEREGIPIRQALESSPHLSETLMLNGERCPVERESARRLQDGDQVYLLAPLAGG